MKLIFFKTLVFALCYSVFFYQFVSVTKDYLRYKTITKVEYLSEELLRPPALTISFETPIPIADLFSKAFPNRTYPYQKVKEEIFWQNSTLGQHCKNLSNQFRNNELKRKYWDKAGEREVWQCFDYYFGNDTIKAFLKSMPQFYGKYINASSNDYLNGKEIKGICRKNAKYSIGFGGDIAVTLFSNLPPINPESRLFVQYEHLKIQPFKNWQTFIQVHAPDAVANIGKANTIDIDSDQTIDYHSVTIERLASPYDTGCHDYQDPVVGISQSDCVAICLFGSFLVKTPNGTTFNKYFSFRSYFIKSELFPDSAKMSQIVFDLNANENIGIKEFQETKFPCQKRCPKACKDTVFKRIMKPSESLKDEKEIFIKMRHQYESDQLYSHVAAFDWFSFLGTLGGLAGMWVGVSFKSLWSGFFKLYNRCPDQLRKQNLKNLHRLIRRKLARFYLKARHLKRKHRRVVCVNEKRH